MPQVYQGDPSAAPPARIAIVVSRYNESITAKLLSGAVDTLTAAGVADPSIDIVWVPGAWEIPVIAGRLAARGCYAALICLGAVIRGETTHDEHISRAVSLRLSELAATSGIPVLFGLLTCQTLEQAIHRAGGSQGNKGAECASAALEMVSLTKKLPSA